MLTCKIYNNLYPWPSNILCAKYMPRRNIFQNLSCGFNIISILHSLEAKAFMRQMVSKKRLIWI